MPCKSLVGTPKGIPVRAPGETFVKVAGGIPILKEL